MSISLGNSLNATAAANKIAASPDGSSGVVSVRAMTTNDLPATITGQLIVHTGTLSALSSYVAAAGEVIYATDTKQMFVGDGTTAGGNEVLTYIGTGESISLPFDPVNGNNFLQLGPTFDIEDHSNPTQTIFIVGGEDDDGSFNSSFLGLFYQSGGGGRANPTFSFGSTAADSVNFSVTGGYIFCNRIIVAPLYSAPITGATVIIPDSKLILNPSGSLSALTISMPTSSLFDGHVVRISCTQVVSTVTYTNGTMVNPLTAFTAGSFCEYTYTTQGSQNKWFRTG